MTDTQQDDDAGWFTCYACDSRDVYIGDDKKTIVVTVNGVEFDMCYDCRTSLAIFLEIFRLGANYDLWGEIHIGGHLTQEQERQLREKDNK